MNKFTKNIWNVGIDEKYGPYVYDDSDAIIAVIRSCGYTSQSQEKEAVRYANARLIAAAPEMYKLLQEILKIHNSKVEASIANNDSAYMMAVMAQNRAVNMIKEILTRIDSTEGQS